MKQRYVGLLLMAFTMLMLASTACAKHTNYMHTHNLDPATDAFWQINDVAVIQIVAVGRGIDQEGVVTYRTIETISGSTVVPKRTVPTSFFFGNIFAPARSLQMAPLSPVGLRKNALLVIYVPKNSIKPIYATPISSPAQNSDLVQALTTIAHLRNAGNKPTDLAQAALVHTNLVLLYSLRLLTQHPQLSHNSLLVNKLVSFRHANNVDASERILASQTLNALGGHGLNGGDQYDWLKRSLEQSRSADDAQLSPFIDGLISFPDKRTQTVSFLTDLMSDSHASHRTRSVIATSLTNPLIFNRLQSNDPLSQTIFNAYLILLRSQYADLRGTAAGQIRTLCNLILGQPEAAALTRRAKDALQSAINTEKNSGTLFGMRENLREMSDPHFFAQ